MSTATLAPRKPVKRDDVISRTPLRLRERVAFVRYWLHVHPKTHGALRGGVVLLTLEHYSTTFPAIQHAATGTWSLLSAVYGG